MTVSSTTTKNSYSGNGSTTVFAYGFKVFDEDDLTVILRTDATGAEAVQSITTNYTVSGVGNTSGGNVTFVTAPASGITVVIRRASPLTQTTDYTPNDPFPAASHEDALDNLTFIAQQQQEELDRAIKLSRTNTMTSTEFTVGATDRANKVLAFDSSGEISVTQELGTFKGNSATTTTAAFVQRDIVKSTTTAQLNNIYICVADSAIGDLLTDTNHWALLVDAVSAATSATAAAASAAAASTSETNAAASATAAAASEAGVAADAAAAETAKLAAQAAQTAAETAETNAETAETNAETAETNAAASQVAAASSASSASSSASTATTKAAEASTSATNAATSATTATTQASTATTKASEAATSATNAATSESNASTSETNAAASAAAAAASFDAFDDIYLGAKSSAPTVDNDGDALTAGDQYFNTTNNTLFVWNGSAWQSASPDVVGDTTPQLGGDLDTNGNDINFGDNDKAIFGAGSDLQIYHTGANSWVQDAGTGNLILAADNLTVNSSDGTQYKAQFATNGAVTLYYGNAPKIATTATGVDVTGTVTATGLTVDSSTGITVNGPSSSDGKLNLVAYAGTQNAEARILAARGATSGTDSRLKFYTNNGTSLVQRVDIDDTGDISFYDSTGVSQGLFWQASTQRLGLGTTTPAGLMEVKVASGQYGATQGYRLVTADGGGYAVYPTSAVANPTFLHNVNSGESQAFGEGGVAHMTITSGGSVGIGTAVPSEELTISKSDDARVSITSSSTSKASMTGLIEFDGSDGRHGYIGAVSGDMTINTDGGYPIKFQTTGTERLRILSDGSVQFKPDGTTVDMTLDASGNLFIAKTSDTSTGVGITLGAAGYIRAVRNETIGVWNRQGSDGTVFLFARSDSGVGSIDVTTSGTTYNTTSDIRLKQDIEPLEATDKLMAMNPVSYSWKVDPDGPRSMGFIAQEMQEVMPEAVSTGDDDDAMMSMDYGRITPILVSALQDAHRKIEDLESRIAALEAN